MKKQILYGLTLFVFVFSLVSGCKVKKKMLKESISQEQQLIESSKNASAASTLTNTSTSLDTSKIVKTNSEKSSTKRTTEITIELDSGKRTLKADTSGNFSIGHLVNQALQNARSIRVKVEEEQHKDKSNRETENRHISKSDASKKQEQSKSKESSKQATNESSSNKEATVTKDSTIGINWIKLWPLLLLAVLILAFTVYRKFK